MQDYDGSVDIPGVAPDAPEMGAETDLPAALPQDDDQSAAIMPVVLAQVMQWVEDTMDIENAAAAALHLQRIIDQKIDNTQLLHLLIRALSLALTRNPDHPWTLQWLMSLDEFTAEDMLYSEQYRLYVYDRERLTLHPVVALPRPAEAAKPEKIAEWLGISVGISATLEFPSHQESEAPSWSKLIAAMYAAQLYRRQQQQQCDGACNTS